MFREMRRIKQALNHQEIVEILERNTNGILSCLGDDDYPYGVPMSYTYEKGRVYFHSASKGHKIDAILKHPKVSFTIVDQDKIVSEELTTYFRSVILFGQARLAQSEEVEKALGDLVEKYSVNIPEERKQREIEKGLQTTVIIMEVEDYKGKEAIELVRLKK